MASDCASAEASLISEIAQNPAGFYVNVHTSDFPGGAVRGQLAQAPPDPAPEPAGPASPPQLPATGEEPAPAALPNTGMGDRTITLLAGVVLLAVAAGFGLIWSARRRTGTR